MVKINLTTTKQAAQNIFSRLNWKVYKPTLISIITFLSIFPCILFFPERYAWENHFIENFQLIILFIIFLIALNSPRYKKLFNWITIITVILFLREINCGRIFFKIEGCIKPTFKVWNEILPFPYNYIPIILYSLLMFYAVFYFFKSKAYIDLFKIIKFAKIDCINTLFILFSIILGTLSENKFHNVVLEETTETLFYVSFCVLVYLYGYNKNYSIK